MTTADATQDLEVVKQEVTAFAQTIPTVISTAEEFQHGSTLVVAITKELKARKAWFAEFLAPAKRAKEAAVKALKEQEGLRDKTLEPLIQADAQLRQGLLTFKREEDARVRREQERQNKLYEQRMAKAEAKGKPLDEVKPPVVLATPQKTTKTEDGGFSVKTIKRLVILDEGKIPEQYWQRIRNDKLIEQTLRAGVDVPGAILKEDYSTAVRVS